MPDRRESPEPTEIELAAASRTEALALADLRVQQAIQGERLNGHDKVIASLTKGIDSLVNEFKSFKLYLVLGGVVVFAGTTNGGDLLHTIVQLVH